MKEEIKAEPTDDLGESPLRYWKDRLAMKLWNFRQSIPKSRKKEVRIVGDVGIAPA